MGVGGQHHAPAAFTPGKDPVPIVQEAGWASESVWIGAENLTPTRIRSPDCPAISESLYRLSHPGSGLSNKTNETHRYGILIQLLHLHVSVYMTILRVLTEYISVVMWKVQYICIYNSMM
jgi:hypothetical protein